MTALLRAIAGITLLRQDPGDLPASTVLVALTGAAYVACSAFTSWLVFDDEHWIGRSLVGLVATAAPVWLLLLARARQHRFRQTMTAVFGTSVLLAPLGLPFSWLAASDAAGIFLKTLAFAALFAYLVWAVFVAGHILRSALEVSQPAGIALAVAWFVLSNWLVFTAYPKPAG